jgi:hypothetical protein
LPIIIEFSILDLMSVCTKFVVGRGFAPDPTGGAYDAPPDPLVGYARVLRTLGSRFTRARLSCARFAHSARTGLARSLGTLGFWLWLSNYYQICMQKKHIKSFILKKPARGGGPMQKPIPKYENIYLWAAFITSATGMPLTERL